MNNHEKFEEIRQILLGNWDPLNVGENPNLSDEYDSYIPHIVRLLQQGCASKDIEEYLKNVESELGINTLSKESRVHVGELLLATK